MNRAYEAAIREAYATARTDLVYLETLQISSDVMPPVFLVKDLQDHVFTLEDGTQQTFVATAFRLALPASNATGLQDLNLAIDNVDRRISDFVVGASKSSKPVEVTYRPYIHTDKTKSQLKSPLILFLNDIQVTPVEVSARASFADVLNRRFLTEYYTRRRFPSL